MERMKLPEDSISINASVYVIFRVFNLGKDNMAVRIYLDPAGLSLNDKLEFVPESYSVVPLNPVAT